MFDTKLPDEYASAALYALTQGHLWIQESDVSPDYNSFRWNALELGSRPKTTVEKPSWELLMETARDNYLNTTTRSDGILHQKTERFISTIYGIPDGFEDYKLRNEIYIRKLNKENTQRDIITALKKLATAAGVGITLPTRHFECEDYAREAVKAKYNEKQAVIYDTNSSASALYNALKADYAVSTAIGCFEMTSEQSGEIIEVFNIDDLQVGRGLSLLAQKFPISEIIGNNLLKVVAMRGENLNSLKPAATLDNLTNRTIYIYDTSTSNSMEAPAGVATFIPTAFLPATLTSVQ